MELIGQYAESEKQPDEIDLVEVERARQEPPAVDLFGSGLGVKSRLRASNFIPAHNTLPEVFTGVRKDLSDTEGAMEALEADARAEYLGREEANRKRAQADALLAGVNRRSSCWPGRT